MADIKITAGLDSSEVTTGMDNIAKRGAGLSAALSGVGAKLAAAFSIGSMIRFSRAVIDLSSDIVHAADAAGISTTQYQALSHTFMKVTGDGESFGRMFGKLEQSVGEAIDGKKEYQEALSRMGIGMQSLIDMPLDQKLEHIAKQFVAAQGTGTAFSDTMRLLGKAAMTSRAALEEIGTKGLAGIQAAAEAANQIVSEDTLRRIERAGTQLSEFGIMAKGLAATLYTGAVDRFAVVFERLMGLAGASKVSWSEVLGRRDIEAASDALNKFDEEQNKISDGQEERARQLAAAQSAIIAKQQDEAEKAFVETRREEIKYEEALFDMALARLGPEQQLVLLREKEARARKISGLMPGDTKGYFQAKQDELRITKDIESIERKLADDRTKKEKDIADIRRKGQAEIDALGNKSYSVIGTVGDALSRIGGSFGGAGSAQLRVADRAIQKADEQIRILNAIDDDIKKLDTGYTE